MLNFVIAISMVGMDVTMKNIANGLYTNGFQRDSQTFRRNLIEDEYRDNIPENMQGSERYESSEESSDNMENAIYALEEAISYIEDAVCV